MILSKVKDIHELIAPSWSYTSCGVYAVPGPVVDM